MWIRTRPADELAEHPTDPTGEARWWRHAVSSAGTWRDPMSRLPAILLAGAVGLFACDGDDPPGGGELAQGTGEGEGELPPAGEGEGEVTPDVPPEGGEGEGEPGSGEGEGEPGSGEGEGEPGSGEGEGELPPAGEGEGEGEGPGPPADPVICNGGFDEELECWETLGLVSATGRFREMVGPPEGGRYALVQSYPYDEIAAPQRYGWMRQRLTVEQGRSYELAFRWRMATRMLQGPCRGSAAFFVVNFQEEPGQPATVWDPGLAWCDELAEASPGTYATDWKPPQTVRLEVPDRGGDAREFFVQFLVSNSDSRWTAAMLDDVTITPVE